MKKTILSLITASTLFLSINASAMEFVNNGVRVGVHIADPVFTGVRYDEMATDVELSRAPLIVNLLNSKLNEINALLASNNAPYKIVDFRLENYGYKDWKKTNGLNQELNKQLHYEAFLLPAFYAIKSRKQIGLDSVECCAVIRCMTFNQRRLAGLWLDG